METHHATPQHKEKLLYLESLRGIAALIVALFHAQFLQGSIVTDSFLRHGYLMVDFFFVLSGFVIAYNYYDKIKSWQNIWVFQARRFLRLYPLHFLTLLVFVGIECAKYIFEAKAGIVANNPAFTKNDWGAFFSHLTLTHSIIGNESTFNEPSWSISAEFYTYLVFALILLVQLPLARVLILLSLMITAATYSLWLPHTSITMPDLFEDFMRCIYCFILGAFVFLIARRINFQLPTITAYIGVIACFAMLFLRPWMDSLYVPLFFALTVFTLYKTDTSLIKRLLEKSYLVFLGTISYGIYMWHEAVWWVINNGLKYAVKIPMEIHEASGKKIMILSDIQIYIILVTGLIITFIVSWLSYKIVEMPINHYRHKLKLNKV